MNFEWTNNHFDALNSRYAFLLNEQFNHDVEFSSHILLNYIHQLSINLNSRNVDDFNNEIINHFNGLQTNIDDLDNDFYRFIILNIVLSNNDSNIEDEFFPDPFFNFYDDLYSRFI